MKLKELLNERGVFTHSMTIMFKHCIDVDRLVVTISVPYSVVENNELMVDEVEQFIKSAIQEKYERDFTELRWIKVKRTLTTDYDCPKCETISIIASKFCGRCGQRLLPPEGEK